MEQQRQIVKAAGAMSLATLISRILGLVREQVLAAYFSAFATDAYFVAFRIPNLLRDLFAEGALSSAFVPTFTEYLSNRGKAEAWRLASIVINALLLVLSVVTLVFFLGAKYLVIGLATGFLDKPGKVELSAKLAQIMSPFLLFVALAAAVMGILNVHGRFFVPSLAPAIFNAANILAGVLLAPLMPHIGQEPIVAMAIGSLLGSMGQLLVQLPWAFRAGFSYRPIVDFKDPGLRRIAGLMLPAVFGLAVTQINILIDQQMASRFGDGPISYLNYAFRLMQLPIGLFGVAIATANLAIVSRHVARHDYVGLKEALEQSLRLAVLLTFPATLGLIFLREPIIRAIFEHGKFTPSATQQTAAALLFYSLGLFAYSAVKILTPTFYALGDTKTPVAVSAAVILAKVAMNLILIAPLGFLGLALSTSIAATLNFAVLSFKLRAKIGGFAGGDLIATANRVMLASVAMGLACYALYNLTCQVLDPSRPLSDIANLALTITSGVIIFMSLCRALKVKEVGLLLEQLKRRISA